MGRFVQPDPVVPEPGNPQSLNRYSYTLNNPLRYIDPSGLFTEEEIMQHFGVETWDEVLARFESDGILAGQWGWLEVLRRAETGDYVRAAIDPWPWQSGAPIAFAGNFLLEQGQISLGLTSGQRISATAAGQRAVAAGVTRYKLAQRRGPVIWLSNVHATRKHYHLRYRTDQVDRKAVFLDTIRLTGNLGPPMIATGLASSAAFPEGGVALMSGGIALTGLDVGASAASVSRTLAKYKQGEASRGDLAVNLGTSIFGLFPPTNWSADLVGLAWNLRPVLNTVEISP